MAEEKKLNKIDQFIKDFGYTKTLFLIFVLPFIFLFRVILKNVQKKPFFIAIAIICVLGWAWSIYLSYKGWWVFPREFILGIYPLPHLPLEEFIIYPLGGIFSIFIYTFLTRRGTYLNAYMIWAFLLLFTAVFVAVGIVYRDMKPYYLYSQLVLYNGLSLLLSFYVAKDINVRGLFVSVCGLSAVGFVWDFAAFRYNWWIYIAITKIKILNIPIEDFNFYLFAPTAAIALYVSLCRYFKVPQTPPAKPASP